MGQNPNERLQIDVKRFLEVYKVISPEARAQFESQLKSTVISLDEKTKLLYFALLQSAQAGDTVEEAIAKMKKEADLYQVQIKALTNLQDAEQ
ncbi:hypothetical protein A2291_00675 [candidate division WOR-1 bacterium RIFOXYB2_FULL_42_35]|uniref:Uncharacterized protein n=1 Tax=candidate division WOR-1 bacterium RIFOXYC2_FULL_41_25 TaxID=1802586 RepID=A0A1F4TJY3_UNCSA|nr:MAG: hypothetical protein A2247_06950 [candidate division WOR-1 bacterium RIFOXYA2_FULL_41_14]OGC23483.1 MAG: hypothetical protein A2291_00675 [candidate division WOR-1 bacterium RIFOXYB2_FULL_42_35]OGC33006.1 MAG: hypothetical protein A2462_03720 [candidate division WOR-1 bacterium RIFOXYC2_FULL_41_25]